MKSLLCAICTAALLWGISLAQDSTSPSTSPQQAPTTQTPSREQAPQPSSPQTTSAQGGKNTPEATGVKRLAPGSVIPVQLTKSIDAKKAKTGDEVVAKVTQDMKNNAGEVIVAKDTKVLGHVTEAQPRSKEQKESQVAIAFDRAVTKNGGEMQMPMSIQAIIGPQNNNPNAGAGQSPEQPSASRQTGGTGRTSGMGGGSTPPPPPSSGSASQPSDQTGNARPPITAQTQGVIGISDLKLENAAQTPTQGSVVSSEKNNVKLDSGTMMLLRVNQ